MVSFKVQLQAMSSKKLEALLRKNPDVFHTVVPFEKTDKLLFMDFSDDNTEINSEIWKDTNRFISHINGKLEGAGAKYGVGGYGELRNIYSRSTVFDSENKEEPRRLHVGIDIWGKPYTKVMSPLDAIVHSFAFNNEFGDYGATIILTHYLEGTSFHTLYGHLSLNSIKNVQEGERINRGDVFAEFGIPFENGQWPPHLHFQVMVDMEGKKGDYPGVCKYSEREKYLSNCPDPDLILQMMQYAIIN